MKAATKWVPGYLALFSALAICGCGGAGGGPDNLPSQANSHTSLHADASFPLLAAYNARIANGESVSYDVSGSCNGTATSTTSKPVAATLEGVAGFSTTTSVSTRFTDCDPASFTSVTTDYYDANYNPLGSVDNNSGEYGIFLTVPAPLPASVKVGDTAIHGTKTLYSDSTRQTPAGQDVYSYVIEADTDSTAIANLIVQSYDAANRLIFTAQGRYRITMDGAFTPVSREGQDATGNIRLVFTVR